MRVTIYPGEDGAKQREEDKQKILIAKWFLFGYVLGSAVVAALLQIF